MSVIPSDAPDLSLDDAVDQIAQKYGVPKAVYTRMLGQESGNNSNAVSPKGATSAWQIMPGTAKGLGVNPKDPLQAAEGGLRLLRDNYKRFRPQAENEKHAWMMAVAGYHGNPNNVEKDLKRGGYGLPDISDGSITTKQHVLKIFDGLKNDELDRAPGIKKFLKPTGDLTSPPVASQVEAPPVSAEVSPPASYDPAKLWPLESKFPSTGSKTQEPQISPKPFDDRETGIMPPPPLRIPETGNPMVDSSAQMAAQQVQQQAQIVGQAKQQTLSQAKAPLTSGTNEADIPVFNQVVKAKTNEEAYRNAIGFLGLTKQEIDKGITHLKAQGSDLSGKYDQKTPVVLTAGNLSDFLGGPEGGLTPDIKGEIRSQITQGIKDVGVPKSTPLVKEEVNPLSDSQSSMADAIGQTVKNLQATPGTGIDKPALAAVTGVLEDVGSAWAPFLSGAYQYTIPGLMDQASQKLLGKQYTPDVAKGLDIAGKFVSKVAESSKQDAAIYRVPEVAGNIAAALPRYAITTVMTGGNVIAAFAVESALRSKGRGEDLLKQGVELTKGAALGAVFHYTDAIASKLGEKAADISLMESAIKRTGNKTVESAYDVASTAKDADVAKALFVGDIVKTVTKYGTIGAAGYGAGKIEGLSDKEAAKQGGIFILQSLVGDYLESKAGKIDDFDGTIVKAPDETGKPTNYLLTKNSEGDLDVRNVGEVPEEMVQAVVLPKQEFKIVSNKSKKTPVDLKAGDNVTIEGKGEGRLVEQKGKGWVVEYNPKTNKAGDIVYQSKGSVNSELIAPSKAAGEFKQLEPKETAPDVKPEISKDLGNVVGQANKFLNEKAPEISIPKPEIKEIPEVPKTPQVEKKPEITIKPSPVAKTPPELTRITPVSTLKPSDIHDLAKTKEIDVNSPVFAQLSKQVAGVGKLDTMSPKQLQVVANGIKSGRFDKAITPKVETQPTFKQDDEVITADGKASAIDSIQGKYAVVQDLDTGRKTKQLLSTLKPQTMLKAAADKSKALGATGTASQWINRNENNIKDWNKYLKATHPAEGRMAIGLEKTPTQGIEDLKSTVDKIFKEKASPEKVNETYSKTDLNSYVKQLAEGHANVENEEIQRAIGQYNRDPEAATKQLEKFISDNRIDSLNEWHEYLTKGNPIYAKDPFFRDWVWTDVTKLRSDRPDLPIGLDKAALAAVYDDVKKNPNSSSFQKVYEKKVTELMLKDAEASEILKVPDGTWIKIPQTERGHKDFKDNVAKVQAVSDKRWCTSQGMAESYLPMGDFWVLIKNNKSELAVRFNGNAVAEIQGKENNGQIPEEFLPDVKDLVRSGKVELTISSMDQILNAIKDSKFNQKFTKFKKESEENKLSINENLSSRHQLEDNLKRAQLQVENPDKVSGTFGDVKEAKLFLKHFGPEFSTSGSEKSKKFSEEDLFEAIEKQQSDLADKYKGKSYEEWAGEAILGLEPDLLLPFIGENDKAIKAEVEDNLGDNGLYPYSTVKELFFDGKLTKENYEKYRQILKNDYENLLKNIQPEYKTLKSEKQKELDKELVRPLETYSDIAREVHSKLDELENTLNAAEKKLYKDDFLYNYGLGSWASEKEEGVFISKEEWIDASTYDPKISEVSRDRQKDILSKVWDIVDPAAEKIYKNKLKEKKTELDKELGDKSPAYKELVAEIDEYGVSKLIGYATDYDTDYSVEELSNTQSDEHRELVETILDHGIVGISSNFEKLKYPEDQEIFEYLSDKIKEYAEGKKEELDQELLKNVDKTKRLVELQDAPIDEEFIKNVSIKRDKSGNFEISPELAVIISRAEGHLNNQTPMLFTGGLIRLDQLKRFVPALNQLISSAPAEITKEELAPLVKVYTTLKGEIKNKSALIYVDPNKIPHEMTHKLRYKFSGFKENPADYYSDFKKLYSKLEPIESDSYDNYFKPAYFSDKNYDKLTPSDKALLHEEIVAHLWDGDYHKIGLSLDQAAKFIVEDTKAYVEKNGRSILNQLEKWGNENIKAEIRESTKGFKRGKINESSSVGRGKSSQTGAKGNELREPPSPPPAEVGSGQAETRRERAYPKTIGGRTSFNPEDLADDVLFYPRQSQSPVVAQAHEWLRSTGITDAYWEAFNQPPTALGVAKRQSVLEYIDAQVAQYNLEGNIGRAKVAYDRALDLISTIAPEATEWGQAISMMNKWSYINPESAVSVINKTLTDRGHEPMTIEQANAVRAQAKLIKEDNTEINSIEEILRDNQAAKSALNDALKLKAEALDVLRKRFGDVKKANNSLLKAAKTGDFERKDVSRLDELTRSRLITLGKIKYLEGKGQTLADWKSSVINELENNQIDPNGAEEFLDSLYLRVRNEAKQDIRAKELDRVKKKYEITDDQAAREKLANIKAVQAAKVTQEAENLREAKVTKDLRSALNIAIDDAIKGTNLTREDVLLAKNKNEFYRQNKSLPVGKRTEKYLKAVQTLFDVNEAIKNARKDIRMGKELNPPNITRDITPQEEKDYERRLQEKRKEASKRLKEYNSTVKKLMDKPLGPKGKIGDWYLRMNRAGETMLTTGLSTSTHNVINQKATSLLNSFESALELTFAKGEKLLGADIFSKNELDINDKIKLRDIFIEELRKSSAPAVRQAYKDWKTGKAAFTEALATTANYKQRVVEGILADNPDLYDKLVGEHSYGFDEIKSAPIPDEYGKAAKTIETLVRVTEGYVHVASTLNRLQENHFRYATFTAVVNMELKAAGFDPATVKATDISIIPRKTLERAVSRALEDTFALDMQKDIKLLTSWMRWVPFPLNPVLFRRFLFNSVKFTFEHSPLVLAKMTSKNGFTKRDLAKGIAGTGMFLLALALLAEFGTEDDKEPMVLRIAGKPIKMEAYNPLTSYLILALMYKRWRDGKEPLPDMDQLWQFFGVNTRYPNRALEWWKSLIALGGTEEDKSTKFDEKTRQVSGSGVAAFLKPLSVLKAIDSAYDEEERTVRDYNDSPFLGELKKTVPFSEFAIRKLTGSNTPPVEDALTGQSQTKDHELLNQMGITIVPERQIGAKMTAAEDYLDTRVDEERAKNPKFYKSPEDRRAAAIAAQLYNALDKGVDAKLVVNRANEYYKQGKITKFQVESITSAAKKDTILERLAPKSSIPTLSKALDYASGKEGDIIRKLILDKARRQQKAGTLDANEKKAVQKVYQSLKIQ